MGTKTVLDVGSAAAVVNQPGQLGNTRRLPLSQQHRVILASAQAESCFGASEVWVPAKSLVNDTDSYIENRRPIAYHHILLAGHEVLVANNLPAESLFVGKVSHDVLDAVAMQEIARAFPQFATDPMRSAHMMLKHKEAQFLALAMGISTAQSSRNYRGRILAA